MIPIMTKKPESKGLIVHTRWAIRRDMDEVLAIEQASFPDPWTDDDFIRCLRQKQNISVVAEHSEKIVGYMVYGLEKYSISLINLAIAPEYRRLGVGAQLIAKVRAKLSTQKRKRLVVVVRETNLDACKFFRAIGFKAVNVLRNYWPETGEAAYRMVYSLGDPVCRRWPDEVQA